MEEDISIIQWRSIASRPENGSYILLKSIDESGRVVCDPCAYEGGKFIYLYDASTWGEINEDIILGWAYYPYDDRLNE